MAVVAFENVDVIFGKDPKAALGMLDSGHGRETILLETGDVVGVNGASLAVEQGEVCVLMGLSGSGKSTLLRCVNGLNRATRGKVLVDDEGSIVDIASCDRATLRRLRMSRIAMVFQQFALLPWRTVRENVGLGLELRGMARPERDQRVDEKLKLVGLDGWGGKYTHELSGGMQQRVGLARAFATDADILLMDEPFSALDPLIRQHLQDELLDLQRTLHKTIIFVSHDLDEALKIGTRIAIMESGRIVQVGRPEEIVLDPASDYVARFVAHMNPLNVLRGSSLMTPVEQLKRQGNEVLLDLHGRCRLAVDEGCRPVSVTTDGRPGDLAAWDENLLPGIEGAYTVVTAPADISMRVAIEIRHATGNPIAMVDEERLIGVIGDDEIYRGMLRQTGIADKAAT